MSKQINITKTNKVSRDGRTTTRVYTITVDGVETDRRTSKTTDYTHFVVNTKTGKHRSARTRQELAQKGLGEYGGPKNYTVVAVQLSAERKAELVEQAVREVAAQLPSVDLDREHELWRLEDRAARMHHRRARQGDELARDLAAEARARAAEHAAKIVAQGGEHPRKLRWK